MMESAPFKRKKNFIKEETGLVVYFVPNHYRQLHCLPQYNHSRAEKAAFRQEVTDSNNAFGEEAHTLEDIKRK